MQHHLEIYKLVWVGASLKIYHHFWRRIMVIIWRILCLLPIVIKMGKVSWGLIKWIIQNRVKLIQESITNILVIMKPVINEPQEWASTSMTWNQAAQISSHHIIQTVVIKCHYFFNSVQSNKTRRSHTLHNLYNDHNHQNNSIQTRAR